MRSHLFFLTLLLTYSIANYGMLAVNSSEELISESESYLLPIPKPVILSDLPQSRWVEFYHRLVMIADQAQREKGKEENVLNLQLLHQNSTDSFTVSETDADVLGNGEAGEWNVIERVLKFTHSPREVIPVSFDGEDGAGELLNNVPLVGPEKVRTEEYQVRERGDSDDFTSLEGSDSERELQPLLEQQPRQETLAQKYVRLLGIDSRNLTKQEKDVLERIIKVEGTWRNRLIWANIETLFHKLLFAATTNKNAINQSRNQKSCDPLWLYGGPVPLESHAAIKRNVVLKSLGHTFEEATLEVLHTMLLALLVFQIYQVIVEGEFEADFLYFLKFYDESDQISGLGILKTLNDHPALFSLLGFPLVFAGAKTVWNASQHAQPTDEAVTRRIAYLNGKSLVWDAAIFNVLSVIPVVSMLLALHPMQMKMPGLATNILWEGHMDPEVRTKALNALFLFAQDRRGYSQMVALEALARIVHGMHVKNLRQGAHDVEGLLKVKLDAFYILKGVYERLPYCSLNKLRTAVLLWEIGQSPSWRVSTVEPLMKLLRTAFYANVLVGIGRALYYYFTCPHIYLDQFSWLGGKEPYASSYSKECFDAQVAAFNLIPGQPAETLVGNLRAYHFPNNSYDLDLSNKGISGSVIADIIEGFRDAKVTLRSLEISNNTFTNVTDIARMFDALVGIQKLDMTNWFPDSDSQDVTQALLGLQQLTKLQHLYVTIPYSSSPNGIVAQVLQSLPDLQEVMMAPFYSDTGSTTFIAQALKPSLRLLDLSTCTWCFREGRDQIAFGNALAQNLTLLQLYLGGGDYLGASVDGHRALAQGIAAQTQLSTLDLSNNGIGFTAPNNNASLLLGSLPSSITNLDISGNPIGLFDPSDARGLAQAVSKMSGLSRFTAGYGMFGQAGLGKFPAFLKALQGKKNLKILDLSWNNFDNTSQIVELLQTIPDVEILNLSNNKLDQGVLLSSALPALRKLRLLSLGNNKFTTQDRMMIWNASRFLPQSPFALDEDLDYTIGYLKSLPSDTRSLDFSGLIQNDPSVLETIMPLIVDLFPSLTDLNLSGNNVCKLDPKNPANIPRGVEALITYLPKIPNLQTLDILLQPYLEGNDVLSLQDPETYYQNISYTIGALPHLQNLYIAASSDVLYADFFGKGLEGSHSLRSVNLGSCWGWNRKTYLNGLGPVIQGLRSHRFLNKIDLSNNFLGLKFKNGPPDPNLIPALVNAFSSWPELTDLNLSGNYLGTGDPEGQAYFLKKLADYATSRQGNLTVNLFNGINSNSITWSQEAENFATLVQKPIRENCEAQLCSGQFHSDSTQEASVIQDDSWESERRKMALIRYQDQHEFQERSVSSSASQLRPIFIDGMKYAASWFSPHAWKVSFNQGLDFVARAIVSYSKSVVEECPSYFPNNALQKASFRELGQAHNHSSQELLATSTPPFLAPN